MYKILTTAVIILTSLAMGYSQRVDPHPQSILMKSKRGNKTVPDRPQEPNSQSITCVYDGTHLHISFVYPEGDATLVVESGISIQSHKIDTSVTSVTEIGPVLQATLTITTDYNNEYVGYIE